MPSVREQEAQKIERGRDRREYFRANTRIPFRYRKVDPEDVEEVANRIRAGSDSHPGNLDPALASWLDRLERKLDRVLAAVGACEFGPLGAEDARTISLSGCGMAFPCQEQLPRGAALLLEFDLSGTRMHRVSVLGEVVYTRPDEAGGASQTAVRFNVIHETDRDAIVRHVLDVQRRDIQLRSAGEDDF